MKIFKFLFVVLFINFLPAQHQNILISTFNAPNEPSIMIDPANTNIMVAATNLNNFYYSSDGGQT
jgi:hypothetical protein